MKSLLLVFVFGCLLLIFAILLFESGYPSRGRLANFFQSFLESVVDIFTGTFSSNGLGFILFIAGGLMVLVSGLFLINIFMNIFLSKHH